MNNIQRNLVMSWLNEIEAHPDEMLEVMDRCATNGAALCYFLMRAMHG